MGERLRRRWAAFNALVDAEQIVPFQRYVYYPLIIGFSLYLAFITSEKPQGVDVLLGHSAYHCWLVLGSVFPAASLLGRKLFDSSLNRGPGEPNSAYGGACLMLAGDAGVWAAIVIYLSCLFSEAWWGEALWGTGFVVMGVPGGAIFTYRSWRRMRQIRRRIP
ncbi:hypothetical protein OS122_02410 [Mycolicibacterium mucogenicum]|uniref:hypothetical protein n=1 Tax=Mycolicibacterium mucogenicum TaxID=56689 RepID=UPI00226A64F5|nr:hypothetical protein [Mycolicibacterium mucogenicum]MCX8559751.1 hypothetical protein [Mycolicibacterium mucogenicum]